MKFASLFGLAHVTSVAMSQSTATVEKVSNEF